MSNDCILLLQLKEKKSGVWFGVEKHSGAAAETNVGTGETCGATNTLCFSFLKQVKESSLGKNKTRHFPLLVKEEDGSQKWKKKEKVGQKECTQEISDFKAEAQSPQNKENIWHRLWFTLDVENVRKTLFPEGEKCREAL